MPRSYPLTIEIKFTNVDFHEAFQKIGIEPESVTDEEWRSFEKMFMSGIQWSDVADDAAWNIKYGRENELFNV